MDITADHSHWRYDQARSEIPDLGYQAEIDMLERSLLNTVATPTGRAPAIIARLAHLRWAAKHQHVPTGGQY